MEWDDIEGNWKHLSASMKEKWKALTDDDLQFLERNKDAMVSRVRARTGLERSTAERQLDALVASLAPAQGAVRKAADPIVPPSGAKPPSQG